MKKLIVCCLIVLLGSCKDKNDGVDPVTDYAPDFVGNYTTATAFDTYNTDESWAVGRTDKNLLNITYTEVINITKPIKQTQTYVYSLKNVVVSDAATIKINESADFDKNGTKIRAKVEGTGVKSVAGGVTKIGITFKITDLSTNEVTNRELLEFKKK